jgi:hypothetical protein
MDYSEDTDDSDYDADEVTTQKTNEESFKRLLPVKKLNSSTVINCFKSDLLSIAERVGIARPLFEQELG